MKILLTGHKGFIGKYLLEELRKENNQIYTVDKDQGEDLCDENFVSSLPSDIDMIYHLAAFNGTKHFYTNPVEVCLNNTLPTINLIKKYNKTNVKFVFASTCEIFNSTIDMNLYDIPTDENVPIMFKDIKNPRWSYSIPKALGENLIANCGLDWLVIRYFNIYGPGQKDHFLPEFIDRVKNEEFVLYGNDTRSFCYVEDAAKLTYKLSKLTNKKIVNIGCDQEISIKDVAIKIMKLLDKNPQDLIVVDGKKVAQKEDVQIQIF